VLPGRGSVGAKFFGSALLQPAHSVCISLWALFFIFSGLASFIEAKDDGSGGDNWSYKSCKDPVKWSPPTNQYPVFYTPAAKLTVSEHWRKTSHSKDLLIPSSPGCLPTLFLTTSGSWLPWGGLQCLSSVLCCQYPSAAWCPSHCHCRTLYAFSWPFSAFTLLIMKHEGHLSSIKCAASPTV